jgi:hypothetical protein
MHLWLSAVQTEKEGRKNQTHNSYAFFSTCGICKEYMISGLVTSHGPSSIRQETQTNRGWRETERFSLKNENISSMFNFFLQGFGQRKYCRGDFSLWTCFSCDPNSFYPKESPHQKTQNNLKGKRGREREKKAHAFGLEQWRGLVHRGREKALDLVLPNHKLQYLCFC